MPTRRSGGDEGQVMLLSIAYGVLALLLVTAIASAASIHLERKALLALADLAALDAADALEVTGYYGRTVPVPVEDLLPITASSVRSSVEAYLAHAPESDELHGLQIVAATTPDGRTAEVTLRSLARPPLITWITAPWSDGIALQVTARARAG